MKTCLEDKTWRMKTLYKIKDKQRRLICFERNKAQGNFAANCMNRNIVLKSRQLGITTDETIDSLDDVLFIPNLDALLIAHEKEEALKLFDNKVDLAWKNIHEPLKEYWKVDSDRANTLKFGHKDGSYSSISVATSGRSGTYHRVHISEFGKICAKYPAKAEEIISGTMPAVPLEGRIDIESTAEGDIGEFHDMFWKAWNRQGGRNFDPKTMKKQPMEYAAFFYNWTWDEDEMALIKATIPVPREFQEYQQKHNLTDIQITYYYQKFLALNENWKRLRQQYPTTPEEAFSSSGDRLFDPDKVKACEQEYPERQKIGDWIYLKPYNNRHRYGGGADVAEGVGGDSSSATIWDFDENEVVAFYASNQVAPDVFAYEIRDGGNRYGTCLFGVERNNHGHATLAKLKELYPAEKIYKEIQTDKLKNRQTEKLGWHTNLATKPKMLFDFKDATDQGAVKLPREIVHEARIYTRDELNRAKADQEATNHFDLLTGTAIGWQMRNYAGKETSDKEDRRRASEIDRAMQDEELKLAA